MYKYSYFLLFYIAIYLLACTEEKVNSNPAINFNNSTKAEYVDIAGSINLSVKIKDSIPDYVPDWDEEVGNYVPDWDEEVGKYVPDWDEELQNYVPDWDEETGSYVPDWDENIGNQSMVSQVKGKNVSLFTLDDNAKPKFFLGYSRLSDKGVFFFRISRKFFDQNLLGIGLGNKNNLLLYSIVWRTTSNDISLKSDLAYNILENAILPFKNEKFGSFSTGNRNKIFELNNTFVANMQIDFDSNESGILQEFKKSAVKDIFSSGKSETLFSAISDNTTLDKPAIRKLVDGGGLLEAAQTAVEPATQKVKNDITFKFADDPVHFTDNANQLTEDDNQWLEIHATSIEFVLGNNQGPYENEKPEHTVTLSPFKITKNEITAQDFKKCVEDETVSIEKRCSYSGSSDNRTTFNKPGKETIPINYVTWGEAKKYCEWLGEGSSLPTEAQWEFAAKGLEQILYPWGDALPGTGTEPFANCGTTVCDDSDDYASPVGSFPAGKSKKFGLNDMAGNVEEWVLDSYSAEFYKSENGSKPDPVNLSGEIKVLRGGSVDDGKNDMQTIFRNSADQNEVRYSIGFRCASKL